MGRGPLPNTRSVARLHHPRIGPAFGLVPFRCPTRMMLHPKPSSRFLWLPGLLAVAGSSFASATSDNIATLQTEGYEVVATTRVAANEADGFVFSGCESGRQIPFANGQTFVCGDDIEVSIEFVPEVTILTNPKSHKTKVIIEGQIFDGRLQGTTSQSTNGDPPPDLAPPPPTLPQSSYR